MILELVKFFATFAEKAIPPIDRVTSPDGKGTLLAVRNGYQIVRHDGPRASAPAHVFRDLDDFAGYLRREVVSGRADPSFASILIREDKIEAVLDAYDRDASVVSCSLESAPGWAAWSRVLGQPLDIDALFNHVRAYGYTFAPLMVRLDGKPVEADGSASVLVALSTFSIKSEGLTRVERGPRGEILARESSEKNSPSVEIPASFNLRLPLFLADSEPVDIEIQVSLSINKDKQGVFRLTAPRAVEAQQKALGNLATKLESALGSGWLVALGRAAVTEGIGAPVGL